MADEMKLYKKEITLTVLVQATDTGDAEYFIKQQLLREVNSYESLEPVEVSDVSELPGGYGIDDIPDNGDEASIRDIIQPSGVSAMRRAIDDS